MGGFLTACPLSGVCGYKMNDLRTLSATDTFRIRSKAPRQGNTVFPLDGFTPKFWLGTDPSDEAGSAFHTQDGTLLAEPDAGIEVLVPASKIKTCVRGALYYWKVRIVSASEEYTVDSGCVKFSDNVI